MKFNNALAAVASIMALARGITAQTCINGTGIDSPSDYSKIMEVPPLFPTSIQTVIPFLVAYETPIQFRLILIANGAIFNSMAMFEPTALDIWGRSSVMAERRRCASMPNFNVHRKVTLGYTLLWTMVQMVPEGEEKMRQLATTWGLDFDKCAKVDCSDVSTPWGLARKFVDEGGMWGSKDGWNADGSLSRSHNKIPYQDWRDDPYIPVNNPWKLQHKRRWQPLLESDNKGFLVHQEHVTPHIGQAGKSLYLGDDDICGRTVPFQKYDLKLEMDLALERTGALNDTTKMEVEYFDGKLGSIVPLAVQYHSAVGDDLDGFIFIKSEAVVIGALYEAVMVCWKEKVRHDQVRPPSIIYDSRGDEKVVTYAGAFAGTQLIKASDWEPYIRTMPHAEFPSGSSCVCEAFAQAMITMTGTDDITSLLGGARLNKTFVAGSSKTEPGATPATDLKFTYGSWSEIAHRCGASRLNGGMHFTASVPAGEKLCGDIGVKVAEAVGQLTAGVRPEKQASLDSPVPPQVRCSKK